MKLISLHIDNFGALKDHTCLFKDGINTIEHENGWGKSTLAAFIRVMFYGFDNETKRSELENERKKYSPWQGGTYGGMLTFEANGKKYRIERCFNEKVGSFALYDANTNLRSDDFSENIGEELFGIDAGSFERTVFIAQQDCETQSTSAINAKIGNIADNTADMGQYEQVQARLKKEADSLTPARKTGAIARLKDDIAARESRITMKPRSEKHRDDIAAQARSLAECRAENERRLKKVQEDMKKLSAIKDLQEKKNEYERLKKAYEEESLREKELRERFPEKEPDEEKLRLMTEKAQKLSSFDQTMKDFRLNENERREEERIYDEYREGFPEESDINKLLSLSNECVSRKNALPSKKANLKMMQDMKEREKRDKEGDNRKKLTAGIALIAIAFVVFLPGYILFLRSGSKIILLLVLALVFAVAGIWSFIGRKPYKAEESGAETELSESIAEDEAFINKTEESVKAFADKLGVEMPEAGQVSAMFEKVREDRKKSEEYSKRRAKFDEAHKQRQEVLNEINGFLKDAGREETVSPEEELQKIREDLYNLKGEEQRLKKAKDELEDFRKDNDTDRLEEDIESPDSSMEELHSQFGKLQDEIEGFNEKIRKYEEELEECDEELSDMENDEEQLMLMRQRLEEMQYRYDIISDTRNYLEKAKISFSQKYMEPIKVAFDKYYSVLSGDDGKEYELDANLNIKMRSSGASRDTGLLSDGYRDLVGLCRRMAMIEAMYKEERPFLILDDPFVNLDNDKVRGGINVLKRISDSYQIIYFTCHDSRAVV